jgi:uncharacterized protein (TIGR00730 family)
MERLCVYCGSSPGRNPAYVAAARAVGRLLAQRSIALVYGGGRVGMMGAVAEAAADGGGEVIGVIPESLAEREVADDRADELLVVDSMHERKREMADWAEGFLALPGGFGTLEEIVEVLTWAQLGFHEHPCGLLNVEGYFDDLVDFFDHQTAEGFVSETHRGMVVVEERPEALLDAFDAYDPPRVEKLLDGDET